MMIIIVVHFIPSAQTSDGQNSLDSGGRLMLGSPELLETGSFKTNSFSASRDCLRAGGAACVCCFRTVVFIKELVMNFVAAEF